MSEPNHHPARWRHLAQVADTGAEAVSFLADERGVCQRDAEEVILNFAREVWHICDGDVDVVWRVMRPMLIDEDEQSYATLPALTDDDRRELLDFLDEDSLSIVGAAIRMRSVFGTASALMIDTARAVSALEELASYFRLDCVAGDVGDRLAELFPHLNPLARHPSVNQQDEATPMDVDVPSIDESPEPVRPSARPDQPELEPPARSIGPPQADVITRPTEFTWVVENPANTGSSQRGRESRSVPPRRDLSDLVRGLSPRNRWTLGYACSGDSLGKLSSAGVSPPGQWHTPSQTALFSWVQTVGEVLEVAPSGTPARQVRALLRGHAQAGDFEVPAEYAESWRLASPRDAGLTPATDTGDLSAVHPGAGTSWQSESGLDDSPGAASARQPRRRRENPIPTNTPVPEWSERDKWLLGAAFSGDTMVIVAEQFPDEWGWTTESEVQRRIVVRVGRRLGIDGGSQSVRYIRAQLHRQVQEGQIEIPDTYERSKRRASLAVTAPAPHATADRVRGLNPVETWILSAAITTVSEREIGQAPDCPLGVVPAEVVQSLIRHLSHRLGVTDIHAPCHEAREALRSAARQGWA